MEFWWTGFLGRLHPGAFTLFFFFFFAEKIMTSNTFRFFHSAWMNEPCTLYCAQCAVWVCTHWVSARESRRKIPWPAGNVLYLVFFPRFGFGGIDYPWVLCLTLLSLLPLPHSPTSPSSPGRLLLRPPPSTFKVGKLKALPASSWNQLLPVGEGLHH